MSKKIIFGISILFLAIVVVLAIWNINIKENYEWNENKLEESKIEKINIPGYENYQSNNETYKKIWIDLLKSSGIPKWHIDSLSLQEQKEFWESINYFWQRQKNTISSEYIQEQIWDLSQDEKIKYIVSNYFAWNYISLDDIWEMSEDNFVKTINLINEQQKEIQKYLAEREKKELKELATQDERMIKAINDNTVSPYIQKKTEIMQITENRCEDVASFSSLWRCLAWSNMKEIQNLKTVLSDAEYEEFNYSYYLETYISRPAQIFESIETNEQQKAVMDALEELYNMWRLRKWHCNNIKYLDAKNKCKSYF